MLLVFLLSLPILLCDAGRSTNAHQEDAAGHDIASRAVSRPSS
jgi:hypothetical protein